MSTNTVYIDIRDPVEKRDQPYGKQCEICTLRDISTTLHKIDKRSKIVIVYSKDIKEAEFAKEVADNMGFHIIKLHDINKHTNKPKVDYKRGKKRARKPKPQTATITVKKRKTVNNEGR